MTADSKLGKVCQAIIDEAIKPLRGFNPSYSDRTYKTEIVAERAEFSEFHWIIKIQDEWGYYCRVSVCSDHIDVVRSRAVYPDDKRIELSDPDIDVVIAIRDAVKYFMHSRIREEL